jgi:hypothetical protein
MLGGVVLSFPCGAFRLAVSEVLGKAALQLSEGELSDHQYEE